MEQKEIQNIIAEEIEKSKRLKTIEGLLETIKEQLEKMNEEVDILKQYQASDVDDAGAIKYFGYVKKNGDWIIKKEDTTAKTYRYAVGDTLWKRTEEEKGYKTAWANRTTLTYFLFYEIF